jgi:hypothetical protein
MDGYTSNSFVKYDMGYGGGFYVGAAFDRHFSVAFKLADFGIPYSFVYSTTTGFSYQNWDFLTSCKYVVGDSNVRPYFTLGMGTDFWVNVQSNYGSYLSTFPLMEGGLGVMVSLGREWDVFAEMDYDLNIAYSYGSGQNLSCLPINVGAQFNLY